MSLRTILYEVTGPLALLSLNRPDKLNAISPLMVEELNQALDAAEANDQVRAIILSGQGRAFSAGFDLDTEEDDDPAGDSALREELTGDFELIMRFWDSPKPTIAAVHGYCLGGALEISLACDLTVAAEDSLFGEPEVKFGSGVVALLLPWICGSKRARELLLTGNDRVDAKSALDYGMVNRVVPADSLQHEARSLGLAVARNDALAVQYTKQAINRGYDIAGMREALRQGLETSIVIETTETAESRRFNEILQSEGTKAAIKWLDDRMNTGQVRG